MPLSWAILEAAGADMRLSCAAAFAIGEAHAATPARVGEAADALGIRLARCQLGLFGRGSEQAPVPSPALVQAVAAYKVTGLTCLQAWNLADLHGESREAVGAAADTAGVKIVACQLGCF